MLWSQETATFSVTDMNTSTPCANGWYQKTTKWPHFVKIVCTASVTCIIKTAYVSKVSFTLRSVHIHLVTKFVIRADKLPTKLIRLAEI